LNEKPPPLSRKAKEGETSYEKSRKKSKENRIVEMVKIAQPKITSERKP